MREITKVFKEMKAISNGLSDKIKETKANFKESQRTGTYNQYIKILFDLNHLQWEFRHFHIARCELRGRTREEIEKPSEHNLPSEKHIQKIKDEWSKKIEEALRVDSERLVSSSTGCAIGSCNSRVSVAA
jgi:hypothetical protein